LANFNLAIVFALHVTPLRTIMHASSRVWQKKIANSPN